MSPQGIIGRGMAVGGALLMMPMAFFMARDAYHDMTRDHGQLVGVLVAGTIVVVNAWMTVIFSTLSRGLRSAFREAVDGPGRVLFAVYVVAGVLIAGLLVAGVFVVSPR